jgi:hypothetical protein
MVSCNAPGCSWEKATTDARGLSRHRATCRFYHNSTVLANQKRQERARQAARTPGNLRLARQASTPGLTRPSVSHLPCNESHKQKLTSNRFYVQQVSPIQHTERHCLKPIFICTSSNRYKTRAGIPSGAASLEHFQQPSEQQQMEGNGSFDNASQADVLGMFLGSRS